MRCDRGQSIEVGVGSGLGTFLAWVCFPSIFFMFAGRCTEDAVWRFVVWGVGVGVGRGDDLHKLMFTFSQG